MAQQSGWMALRTVNLHNHNKAAVLCMCAEKATHQSTLSHMNTCSFQKEGASAVTSEGFFPQRRRRGSQISSTKRVENTKTEEGHGWGWGQRREVKRGNLREWEHSSSVLREVLHLAEAFCRSLFQKLKGYVLLGFQLFGRLATNVVPTFCFQYKTCVSYLSSNLVWHLVLRCCIRPVNNSYVSNTSEELTCYDINLLKSRTTI